METTSADSPPLPKNLEHTPASPVSLVSQNATSDNQTQKQAELPEHTMDVSESNESNADKKENPSFAKETKPADTPEISMDVVPSGDDKSLPKEPLTSTMEVENTKVAETTETPNKPAEIQTRTPLHKEDFLNSPIRSLTPLSENFEQTSPIELMETSDGSVRIKGDLDPSPIAHSYHSRSSSRSPKSLKEESSASQLSPALIKSKKKRPPPPIDEREHDKNDFYCWICHKEGEVLCCELCPRVVHAKCLNMDSEPEGDWYCPECEKIMVAECKETQSRAMAQLSIDQLALHLRYALQRMKTTGCEPFLEPVNTKEFPDYLGYVFHPMDISTLEKNIKKRTYGCTEAFIADVKWIQHNCIIYNGHNTKLTQIAKTITKIAQHEMNEIEVCPECYLNACRKREKWFCEPCKDIHILVWAKLQGFPHWPAKALRIEKGAVDVRFFGQHDRAWVAVSGCYLMSKEMPHPVKNKKKGRGPGAKGGLDNALQEMQCYIDNVIRKTGTFEYNPPRTPLTHLDMCRKPTGTKVHAKLSTSQGLPVSASSITVKKEMLEEEKEKTNSSVKSALGDRVLKIATNVNLTTVSVPPKKSKVVTTSGAHPQKGCRPYTPKKKASLALLEKTIESCKASLRDTVESQESDDSTFDSDSSFESESESVATDKSTPDKEGKGLGSKKVDEKTEKPTEKGSNLTEASQKLVIDEPGNENASKKKDTPLSGLVEKGLIKVKKRIEVPLKTGTKTKSILLIKETDSPKKATVSRSMASLGIKRKLPGDSPQAAASSNKLRKVDTSASAAKSDRANPTSQKAAGKIQSSFKEKKKYNLGDDKTKRQPDNSSSKPIKAGNLSLSAGNLLKKVHPLEASTTKKPQSSITIMKTRHDDDQEKPDLKSAAKLLARKVMTRKQGMVQGKPKSILQPVVKPPVATAAKKLSSFTIPKHKPSTATTETDPPALSVKVSIDPPASQAAPVSDSNVQAKVPAIDLPMQKLKKYSDKVMQNMQEVLADVYEDMVVMFQSTQHGGNPPAAFVGSADVSASHQVSKMRLELEQLKWMHQQEMAELQHNHDLTIAEIRQSLENEKLLFIDVAKRKNDAEKGKAVEEAKKKQWCANCGKEAIFYCCWNTSYCDYPCQQLHWPKHMPTCSQTRDRGATAPNGQKIQVPPTPTSPPKTMESKSIPKPSAESKPDPKDVPMIDEDDDDHSDTDMMVIDETVHKEVSDPAAELMSPQSPEAEADSGKKTVTSEAVVTQTETDTTSSASTIAKSVSPETPPDANVSKTSSAIRPFSVVSVLASEAKIKNLPLRSTSPSVSTASNVAPTKVVPSKLIDDIFLKVHKTSDIPSTDAQPTPPVDTPSIASLKSILDSVSSPTTTSTTDSNKIPTTTFANVDKTSSKSPNKPTGSSQESKAHSSGSKVSAIGERLLKAKTKPADSDSVSIATDATSSSISSSGKAAATSTTDTEKSFRTETMPEDSQAESEVSCEVKAVVDSANDDKKTQKETTKAENKISEVDKTQKETAESESKISDIDKTQKETAESESKISEIDKKQKITAESESKISEIDKTQKETAEFESKISEIDKKQKKNAESESKISEIDKKQKINAESESKISEIDKTRKETAESEKKISEVDSKTQNGSDFSPAPELSGKLSQTSSDDVLVPSPEVKATNVDKPGEEVSAKSPKEREDTKQNVEKSPNEQEEVTKQQASPSTAAPAACSSPGFPTPIPTSAEPAPSVTQSVSITPASSSSLSHQANVDASGDEDKKKSENAPSDVSPSSPFAADTSSMLCDVSSPVFTDPYLSSLPQRTTASTKQVDPAEEKSDHNTEAMETEDSVTPKSEPQTR